jgi:flagellar protein FlbD
MILVTRLNGTQFYVNAELIQYIEPTPDTVITLTNNNKLIVKDKAQDVVEKVIEYQQKIRSTSLIHNINSAHPGD